MTRPLYVCVLDNTPEVNGWRNSVYVRTCIGANEMQPDHRQGSMHPLIQAYELGYHAGINGDDPRTCPFPKMTAEWKSWNVAQQHGANVREDALNGAERIAVSSRSNEEKA